jgi:tetratricopeptide (TPR) repeat protein
VTTVGSTVGIIATVKNLEKLKTLQRCISQASHPSTIARLPATLNVGGPLDYYNESLPLQGGSGQLLPAPTLNNIGTLYTELGQPDIALGYYDRALKVMRALGNKRREGSTLHLIGIAHDALGDRQKALDFYNQALSLIREVGNQYVESNILTNIGRAYLPNDPQKALGYFEQALTLKRVVEIAQDRPRLSPK